MRSTARRGVFLAAVLLAVLPAALAAQVSFGPPVNLGPEVDSASNEGSPCVTADGLELYFHSNRPGGYGKNDIWVCTRVSRNLPWGKAVNLGPVVNSAAAEVAPSISSDGLEMVFSDSGAPRPGGIGKSDVWVTKRPTRDAPWGIPVNLGSPVNSPEDEPTPCLSANGLELYLDSYRAGSLGYSDLWVAKRASREAPWGAPVWLGAVINSVGVEHCPTLSADGLTMFYDMTPPNQATEIGDLLLTRRATLDSPWEAPLNLGHEYSTHWASALGHDGSILYFSSTRPGGQGGNDLWQTTVTIGPYTGR